MNLYSTGALTTRNGHAALYAALGYLRQELTGIAPAIAPGLTMTSDGALTVDMYAADDDATDGFLPYDEQYANVGWVYRDEDTHRVMIALTGSGEHIPLTDSAQDVVFAVASAIVGVVGGDTGVTRNRRCVMSGPDYGDETIAVTHSPLPTTIAILRDAQVMRLAASVSSSLSACHSDAACRMGADSWPEVTVYASGGTAVLASVDLTEDRDGVVLTDPAGLTYTLYPGDREALDWRDEEDVVRPVCDAVRAALDTHTDS